MNFNPTIPTSLAVIMGLLAAFMWGTWFISLKYLHDYPIEAFYLTLFTTSLFLVWGIGAILDGRALFQNLKEVWLSDPGRILITFLCGFLYVAGILLSLKAMKVIGLSLSQPLQSSINLIGGTVVSGLIGGIPASLGVGRIIISAFLLLAAIVLTMQAGNLRNRAGKSATRDSGLVQDPKIMRRAITLLILGSALIPAYSTGLSYGLKTVTQPSGMAVMPFMVVLCTGAFISAVVFAGISLTINRQWHLFKPFNLKIQKYGILSAFAHYGGNIIHTFATRNLSSVVAWPIGITSGLWTTMWGIVYGEFKGAPLKAYLYLASGVTCYLLGALVIANII